MDEIFGLALALVSGNGLDRLHVYWLVPGISADPRLCTGRRAVAAVRHSCGRLAGRRKNHIYMGGEALWATRRSGIAVKIHRRGEDVVFTVSGATL